MRESIRLESKVRKGKKSGKKRKRIFFIKKTGNKKKAGTKRRFSGKALKNGLSGKMQIAVTILLLAVCLTGIREALFYKTPSVKTQQTGKAGPDENNTVLAAEDGTCGRPEITTDFLDVNPYSRSGRTLKAVKGVVIHYVANPGSTAKENRDYFENLKDTHLTKASSHYIIGLEGEIIQCIPQSEISYASNNRNSDTISIECCHPGESGKFNKKTYASLVQLTAWICDTYGLSSEDVIRHYDVTGKLCPKYYVEHKNAWKNFQKAVQKRLDSKG